MGVGSPSVSVYHRQFFERLQYTNTVPVSLWKPSWGLSIAAINFLSSSSWRARAAMICAVPSVVMGHDFDKNQV
jgi:hypothetical protein